LQNRRNSSVKNQKRIAQEKVQFAQQQKSNKTRKQSGVNQIFGEQINAQPNTKNHQNQAEEQQLV
jgi:hypothetical protein